MSIFVAEVFFFYEDADFGELYTRVRAAFHDEAAAMAWVCDGDARIAQAREEWNPDFGETPTLAWPATEIRLTEMPLY